VSPSLWDVLTENDALPDPAMVTLEGNSGMADVREQLKRVTAPGFTDTVRESLSESIKGALATPLDDVIAGALGKYGDLLKYCDKTKHPPEEICVVPISSYTIQSAHKPHIDILINGVSKGKLELEVLVVLTIEAATLKIRDGRIWEIRTGACKAEGRLRCGSTVLAEKKLKPINLPGTLTFKSGIAIAGGL
jgi:hypothetical protein